MDQADFVSKKKKQKIQKNKKNLKNPDQDLDQFYVQSQNMFLFFIEDII